MKHGKLVWGLYESDVNQAIKDLKLDDNNINYEKIADGFADNSDWHDTLVCILEETLKPLIQCECCEEWLPKKAYCPHGENCTECVTAGGHGCPECEAEIYECMKYHQNLDAELDDS